MALQFDMSKGNWEKDYLDAKQIQEYAKNIGTGLGVAIDKKIPQSLLAGALAVPAGIIGGGVKAGQGIIKGGKKATDKIKDIAGKVKLGLIGDKDTEDYFEGSQDSPLMGFLKSKVQKQKTKFQGKKRERLLEKAKSGNYYTPSLEDESDFFDIGTDAANYGFDIPTAYQQELARQEEIDKTNKNWETLPRPVTPDYIIEDELREKEKRDLNRRLTSPSEIGQRLYRKKGALDDAMLNQNYGPLQQIIEQNKIKNQMDNSNIIPNNITPDMVKQAPIEYYGPTNNAMMQMMIDRAINERKKAPMTREQRIMEMYR